MRLPRVFKRRLPWPPLQGRPLVVAVIAAGVVALIVIALIVVGFRHLTFGLAASPPGVGTVVLAPKESKAERALADATMTDAARTATEYLASQPTAYWVTPEQDPPGVAGATVTALTVQAREQGVALAIVVYGLPERDCGNHSAGGLAEDDYVSWVDEIARALENAPDVQKIVILEPDSLALATECGNLVQRTEQLRSAAAALDGTDTWIYLDGGHSGWHSPETMADLIRAVDAGQHVRGFATNVSNYRSTFDEFAYARAVATLLPGMHAVIDTARNGAATAAGAWCNPPGQRVGEPGGTFGDDIVDTNLWIKPPGESDGPCNGGPDAGVWWPEGAIDLTEGVR